MTADELWRRFRTSGDAAALGALFDAVSPELFRVALALAPDAASAEDALQETWLVALRSASRHDAARPVVPWLAGILRKKVHEARRRTRRPDERRVARSASPTDPALAAQSAEDVARLRAAIDALPAAQRAVAVLRWRYGLEPGEIADAQRVPPGTVRSLLHRALARLRREMTTTPAVLALVRWPRGLDEVRAAVLRAAARRSATAAALASAGGVVMAKATKTAVIAVVACLLIGAGAAVQLSGRTATSPARGAATSNASGVMPVVHPRGDRAATTVAEASDAAPATPFARGLVVDEQDAPVAGCRVMVRGHEDVGGIQDAPVRLDASAAAVTGNDGRFVVPKKPDDLASLTFVADGYEAVELRSFDADLRVVLAKCGGFSARVVDTAGAPIEGAEARVMGTWDKSGPVATCVWLLAPTDGDGRFVFRSLPRDARLTWISAPGRRVRGAMAASLPVQEEYVLERTSLVVHVRDAASHAPLDGARGLLVAADGTLVGTVAPHDGQTDTPAAPGTLYWWRSERWGDVTADLRVFARGRRTLSMPLTIRADAEPPELTLDLEAGDEAAVLAGRVEAGADAIVEARFAPSVDATPMAYYDDLTMPVAASARVAADGSFGIAGIPPATYRVTVTKTGEVPIVRDVTVPDTSLDLRWPPKASLAVRVTDAAGRPRADEWVHAESPGTRLSWSMQTDATGVARFATLPAAEVVVLPIHDTGVFLPNIPGNKGGLASFQPLPFGTVSLAPGKSANADLVLPDRCRVTAVVRNDAGQPLPGVEVHAKAVYGYGFWVREERDRLPLIDLTSDAEGRVTFEVLPCRGEVKALRHGHVNSTKFTAEAGSSPVVEIRLPDVTGIVRGRVLERGSCAPVAGRPVKVWWDHKVIAESATGDDGRFTASGVPAGRVEVLVEGYTDANDAMGRRIDPKSPYGSASVEFDMRAGEAHDVAVTLPRIKGQDAERATATVDATVVDAAGAPAAGVWVSVRGLVEGAWCSLGDARTDADGRARIDVVAASGWRIAAWSGDRRVEVQRDATPLVERLVLPDPK